jgi:ELWxxDGT repeat protein
MMKSTQVRSINSAVAMATALVVIDQRVVNYEYLAAGVFPGTAVVLLDPSQDGVKQITKALIAHESVMSLHLVSHGEPGIVNVGDRSLSLATLDEYGSELGSWADLMGAGAEVLVYGCEVGAGVEGRLFVERLARITGIRVAASEKKIGAGNWALQVRTGDVSPCPAFDSETMEKYSSTLAPEPVLYNINSPNSSDPADFTDVNGVLYFTAMNTLYGRELWKIDPVTGKPVRVTDIGLGQLSSSPRNLKNVNGTLFFTATNSSNGTELWKLDPTTGNSVLLEIEIGSGSSSPSGLTNINNTLYFTANKATTGYELWKISLGSSSTRRRE